MKSKFCALSSRRTFVLGLFLLSTLLVFGSWATFRTRARGEHAPRVSQRTQPSSFNSAKESAARIADTYGKLPLSFELNRGQTDGRVKFLSRGSGYSVFLTTTEAVIALRKSGRSKPGPQQFAVTDQKSSVLRMKFLGTEGATRVEGLDALTGRANYFIGNDSTKWQTDVPTFRKVHYQDVYPGIGISFYGNHRQLEYDFVVAPGSDPAKIKFKIEGARQIKIDPVTGDLVLQLKDGEVRFAKPVIFQEISSNNVQTRKFVDGGYVVNKGNEIGFEISAYDLNRTLIIDPVLLGYSTYLGGSGDDHGNDVAVDAAGNAYVVGYTYSSNFPVTVGAFQTSKPAPYDAFVTKVDPTGTVLLYSTYLGGSGGGFYNDIGQSIEVDSAGHAYVTGVTNSTNFPTTPGAFQTAFAGGGFTGCCFPGDAFATKLSPTGSALIYSTYVGGAGWDVGSAIAIDGVGNAYLAGQTHSTNFPVTPGAFQTSFPGTFGCGGNTNSGFITKLNPSGTGLAYSTYLGGSGFDGASAIAVDSSGSAYVTGFAQSSNFPTTPGAFQAIAPGPTCPGPAFVTKLDPSGSSLAYSTYLSGTNGYGQGNGIAVDGSGHAYVTGQVNSTTFPTTASAVQTSSGGGLDGFVTKLNPTGSALIYSSYLGGSGTDFGTGISVDGSGSAHITGGSDSGNFPTTGDAFSTTNQGGMDVILARFNATGTALLYSTYFGGSGNEHGRGLALASAGDAYITGPTGSGAFPVTPGVFQTSSQGGQDAFVAKFSFAPPPPPAPCNIVTHTGDAGTGSLRQAINCANTNLGPDTISFNIPTSDPGFNGSVFVIKPFSALPALIDNATTIDGATQTTFTGDTNAAGPEIMVNGSLTGFSAPFGGGLHLLSSGNLINSLVINGFNNTGIQIYGATATGNRVTGCYVGTDATGSIADPNTFDGITISTLASNNVIGGTTPQERNVISGNGRHGVLLFANGLNVTNNVIQGNFIGTNATGLTAMGNTMGVALVAANSNTIGGSAPGAGNLISGNTQEGVHLNASSSQTIQGNRIGTNVNGTAAIPNGYHGINIFTVSPVPSANNVVGGSTVGAGNLVSGNLGTGVAIGGTGSDNNVIQGNRIGTDVSGTSALGNAFDGLSTGTAGNRIGGTAGAERNLISGNGGNGVTIFGDTATGNLVQGNLIGTNAAGSAAIANGEHGIFLIGAPNTTIGGTGSGAGNLVSGNTAFGINIVGPTATGNQLQGNLVGTNAAGSAALPNFHGVNINSSGNTIGGTLAAARNIISGNTNAGVRLASGGATLNVVQGNLIGTDVTGSNPVGNTTGVVINGGANNLIGGVVAGEANVIAFNNGNGVLVVASISVNNAIRQNASFSNGALAIDLGADGVTSNDSCDSDAGPNKLQNSPVLTSICHSGNVVTVAGTLNSTPNTTFTLEFFANASCDSSGFGEGRTYLGSVLVTTDASCAASFTFTGATPTGQPFITATATDPAGSTSEFSNCLTDIDTDGDGTFDCLDACPNDPNKIVSGACGCGAPDTDTDNDGSADCNDACPNDPNKIVPGACGCGVADTDGDADGVPDCNDNCPTTFNPDQRDSNGDGVGDVCTPFEIPAGGLFVIGDLVDQSGGATVYFWGSQWAKNNPMSGGAGPNSFKGFEDTTAAPTCGGTWTSKPGNSFPPAAIPEYMAVIVSSSVNQDSSMVTGNIQRIIIVKTNPGYGSNPGHEGTGQVVAVLCGAPTPLASWLRLPGPLVSTTGFQWLAGVRDPRFVLFKDRTAQP